MSSDTTGVPDIEVTDAEDYTDKKVKQRILKSRENIVNGYYELFTRPVVEPDVEINRGAALRSWGDLVRSYLRELSVLLNHDDLPQVAHYREEVDLGAVTFIPPNTERYPFAHLQHDEMTESKFRIQFNMPPQAELPEVKEVPFEGLMSIVHYSDTLREEWVLTLNPSQAPPNQDTIMLEREQQIPRHIYDRAIMESDQFLQSIGIGLDIQAEDYYGTNGPGL